RTVPVFAVDRSSAQPRVPQVCATLRGQLPGAEFLLLGPVSLHGICPVDLPRESARHRGLPALARTPTLSPRHSRHGLAQHPGRCQRVPRLAHLCRFRATADRGGAATLSPRRPGMELANTVYALDST